MNRKKGNFCPLIDGKCKKSECRWYYGPCEECTIQLLAYNSYRLNMLGQKYIEENEK